MSLSNRADGSRDWNDDRCENGRVSRAVRNSSSAADDG